MIWFVWNLGWTTAAAISALVVGPSIAGACFAIGAAFGASATTSSYLAMKGRNK